MRTKWYDEWTSRHGKTLPEPLPPPDHCMHPKLPHEYAATMQDNSLATDVSAEPGPLPNEAKVKRFHLLEKGTKLSTANDLLYVYHRDTEMDEHHDSQLTALDSEAGWHVFSIKAWFTDDAFDDNVSGIAKKDTLGKDDYG